MGEEEGGSDVMWKKTDGGARGGGRSEVEEDERKQLPANFRLFQNSFCTPNTSRIVSRALE